MITTLPLAYAIAWAGGARHSVPPAVVHSVLATGAAIFAMRLLWVLRRLPPAAPDPACAASPGRHAAGVGRRSLAEQGPAGCSLHDQTIDSMKKA